MVSGECSDLWKPELRELGDDVEVEIWDLKVSKRPSLSKVKGSCSSSNVTTDRLDESCDIGVGESILAYDTMNVHETIMLQTSTNTRKVLVVSDRIVLDNIATCVEKIALAMTEMIKLAYCPVAVE
ncbi:uncharacterized protein G2W53_039191 [Senna tora]|uniref:Uncharacterized protein n=1 Tax=Senna tora TaxID=362788 RepID=A0A834SQB9_9FABA|nr:uncharacterized protein G2W53_039191 [Senna tora]